MVGRLLDLRRLAILREVARHGSFSAAAEALSYTQPAVSQQIATLERELGTQLIERRPKGVRMTEEGVALVRHAEAIFDRIGAAEEELDSIRGLRAGRVRLASFPSASATLLARAIRAFRARHPGVTVSLADAELDDAVAGLRAGDHHLALLYDYETAEPVYDDLALTHLLADPMRVVLSARHAQAQQDVVPLSALRDEAWVQGPPGCCCRRQLVEHCAAVGFEPRVTFVSEEYNVIQGLVAEGLGVSLIPQLAIGPSRDDVVFRPVAGTSPIVRHVFAAVPLGGTNRAAEEMLRLLREQTAADDDVPLPA